MCRSKLSAIVFAVIFTTVLFAGSTMAMAKDSEFIEAFREALYAGDNEQMEKLIDDGSDGVVAEVEVYINEVKEEGIDASEREERFFLLEMITTKYKEKTRDVEPLKAFKRVYFESKLSAPIRSKKKRGVHHVEFVMHKGDTRDKFRPDNIIIDVGDTVRWTNNNKIAHLFATSMFIGEKGIFTPSIKPGKTWEYTFTKPGDYYLICFVHVGMIAKVTVVGENEEAVPEEGLIVDEEPLMPISSGIPMGAVSVDGDMNVMEETKPEEDSDNADAEGSKEVSEDTAGEDSFTNDGFMEDDDTVMIDDLEDEELLLDEEEFIEAESLD